MKKIFKCGLSILLVLFSLNGILGCSSEKEEAKEVATSEVVNSNDTNNTFKNKNDDGTIITRVTKDNKTGEYILQVLVPENATRD